MRIKILAAMLFLPAMAFADPAPRTDLQDAIAREHESANRVSFYARETTIAERDILSAAKARLIANENWMEAIRLDHPAEAGKWAIRHRAALHAEAAARERADWYGFKRDMARTDFRTSAAQARQLSAQARAGGGRSRG